MMLGRKGSGRGRGSADYFGVRAFDIADINRPVRRQREIWRSLLIVASDKPLTLDEKKLLRERFAADDVLDTGHIEAWKHAATQPGSHEWVVVVDAASKPMVDGAGFRRRLDAQLTTAPAVAVGLYAIGQFDDDNAVAAQVADHRWTDSPRGRTGLGLAVLADVCADFALTLDLKHSTWDALMRWADGKGRTVQHTRSPLLTRPPRRTAAGSSTARRRRRRRSAQRPHRSDGLGTVSVRLSNHDAAVPAANAAMPVRGASMLQGAGVSPRPVKRPTDGIGSEILLGSGLFQAHAFSSSPEGGNPSSAALFDDSRSRAVGAAGACHSGHWAGLGAGARMPAG